MLQRSDTCGTCQKYNFLLFAVGSLLVIRKYFNQLWAREFFTIFLHALSSNWKKNWAQWDGIFAVCNCLKHHNLPYLYFRCGGMKIFASFIYTAYPTPRKFPNMYVFQKRFMTSDCFLCHLYQIEFGKLCLSHSGKRKEIWIWNNGCIRSEHFGSL